MSGIDSIFNFRRLDDRITTSGQPSEDQLRALADAGVTTVINLGLHSHERALPDEAASVAAAGMRYVYIPVPFDAPGEDYFAAFADAMAGAHGEKVHVHCIMNMRVTAFVDRWTREQGGDAAAARAMMESVWQPGGAWAAIIGDEEGAWREHLGRGARPYSAPEHFQFHTPLDWYITRYISSHRCGMSDVIRDMGAGFLGSRLKRLGERMQAGAARVIAEAGLEVQPAHMPVLFALDGRALTIGQLVQAVGVSQPGVTRGVGQLAAMGLVQAETGTDQRHRTISLTGDGAAAIASAKLCVWPQVTEAVDRLLAGRADALLAMIADVEDALAATPLDQLAAQAEPELLSIRDYSDDLAGEFHDINAEWISDMFRMEETDRMTLENPRASIIDPGGAILFVEAAGLGIVGTCALQKTSATGFELTKMGVRKAARGLKAGEFLLNAIIARAQTLGADPLYLLTSSRCAAAIHLYEKLGFRHDAGIMADYGARYARCDVAMRYARSDGVAV